MSLSLPKELMHSMAGMMNGVELLYIDMQFEYDWVPHFSLPMAS